MFDTGDYAYNFTFNQLCSVESNTDGFSSCEICSSECLIYYKHLGRALAFTIVEQTSLLQFHSSRLKERSRHDAVICNSLLSFCQVRLTLDQEWQFHCATTERQVRYRPNRTHTRQRTQRLECVAKQLRALRTAIRIISKTQREPGR